MKPLPPINFRILRELISPLQALQLEAWPGRREPCGQWRGPCPIHGSHSTTSRSLSVGARVAYCHVCRWSGDSIQLWATIHGMTLLEAAWDLCGEFAIDPPLLG